MVDYCGNVFMYLHTAWLLLLHFCVACHFFADKTRTKTQSRQKKLETIPLHHTIDGDMFDSDVNTVLLHKSFCHFHGSQ